MSENMNEREIFFQAIELDGSQRDHFLIQQCGDDVQLLSKVKALLREYERDSDLLIDRPFFESEADLQDDAEPFSAGQEMGPYELEERLGEGGMGEVWAARQLEPLQRRVAIKLIRPGMETPGVLQRFDIERQALAAMDHPSIAKIFDAGTTDNRRPYFVMELINGGALTKFCDESQMSIEQRLQIFLQVVLGVQHAHQKAVIHRDLKPSNVLVTMIDGQPIPKIIDFGLAKALAGGFGADTANTHFGAVMGTLQYMAPEQAGYSGQDVDIRTDVYSLGVILYELLTGLQPFDAEDLSNASVDEKLRMVKEVDPPLPSTRLSSSDSALKNASLRQTAATDLSKMLKSELDWIVMKAIQKDRRERYQSARELADDIGNYLSGETVGAHPPSQMYRVRKYIRKNKGLVGATAAVFAVLLLGIAGTTYGLVRANSNAELMAKEAKRASDAEKNAIQQKDAAVAAQRESEKQRKYSDAVAEFLAEDFLELASWEGRQGLLHNNLASTQMDDSLGSEATLDELLNRAATKLEQRTDLDDFISAYLYQVVGRTFYARNEHQRAIEFLERAVEINSRNPDTDIQSLLASKNALSMALYESGNTDRARVQFDQLVELYSKEYGDDHRETISAKLQIAAHSLLQKKYDQANSMFESGIEKLRKLDPNDPLIPMYMSYLGQSLSESGQLERAVELTAKSLQVSKKHWPENHPQTIEIMVKLANMFYGTGQYQENVDMSARILELLPEGADDDYSIRRTVLMSQMQALRRLRREKEASEASESLVEILQKRLELGNENSLQIQDANYLGIVYINSGRLQEALVSFKKAYALLENESASDRPMEASILNGLGITQLRLGNFEESIEPLEKSLQLSEKNTGPESPQTLHFQNSLAAAYRNVGRISESAEMMSKVLDSRKKLYGVEHPSTLTTMNNLAVLTNDLGRPGESIRLLRQLIELREGVNGKNDREVLLTKNTLAGILQHSGNLEEAIAQYQSTLDSWKTHFGKDDLDTRLTEIQLLSAEAEMHAANDDFKAAAANARKSYELQKAKDADHWLTFRMQAEYGMYLLRDKQVDLAKEMLTAASAGLEKHKSKLPLHRKTLPQDVTQLLSEIATDASSKAKRD